MNRGAGSPAATPAPGPSGAPGPAASTAAEPPPAAPAPAPVPASAHAAAGPPPDEPGPWTGPTDPPGGNPAGHHRPFPPPAVGAHPDRPPPRHRRLAAPSAVLAAVAGAFAYVGAVDPNEPGHYPVCPLLQLTGIYCPGCGGLRSAHAFVHGEPGTAFGANALAVAGYLLFAVFWVVWLVRAVRAKPVRITLGPAWWWGLGAVLAGFTVVRNLPFGSGLAP